MLFLQGGPGEAGTADLETLALSPLRRGRDLYVLDQRGTGLSRPALRCPEFDAAAPRFFTRTRRDGAAELRSARAAVRACAARLRASGVHLEAFTTTAAADDVERVRLALGLPPLNLFAVSCGTRAAQEVLRRHPGGHVVTRTSACARVLATSFVASGGVADHACLARERPPRFG